MAQTESIVKNLCFGRVLMDYRPPPTKLRSRFHTLRKRGHRPCQAIKYLRVGRARFSPIQNESQQDQRAMLAGRLNHIQIRVE